ncbi:MAG: hypothetical protein JNK15_20285 [Planctomycetes bacterium]|nr:hypothetical protein [Planctomycetota bacterium]
MTRSTFALLLAGAGLLAQEPAKTPATVDAPPAPVGRGHVGDRLQPLAPASASAHAEAGLPARPPQWPWPGVVFDDHADATWLAAARWKAAIDCDSATFVPFFGSQASCNHPVDFRLRSIAVGGAVHDAAPGRVRRDGHTVRIERPDVVESYVASDAGIEQRFAFATLPARGELVLDLAVHGDFTIAPAADGHRFEHELGAFTYGKAIAFDADGKTVEVVTERTGDGFQLRVPAAFVASARLPLVVDPLLGNVVTVATPAVQVASSDIAYDGSLDQYVVSWEQVFSAADSDVWMRRHDQQMQPLGAEFVADITTTSWSAVRIANVDAEDMFLCVAQCASGALPTWIGARRFDAGSVFLHPPAVVWAGTAACVAPDVGGDPNPTGAPRFTVVWEYEYSAVDHDIKFVQIATDGSLAGAIGSVDSSVNHEHSPRISKSNGVGNDATWAVVYRRDNGNTGQTRAGFMAANGQLTLFGTNANMALGNYAVPSGPVGIAVSSPTDAANGRVFLVADTVIDAATSNRHLRGTAVDRLGVVIASGQQISYPADPDFDPELDCDGTRFGFVFTEVGLFGGEHCAGVLDVVGGSIVRPEGFYVGNVAGVERTGGIVARHSGGTTFGHERQYGMVWASNANGAGTVLAQRYLGMGPGGWSARANGCGLPLGWSTTGSGAIGETVGVQLLGSTGIGGWAFGSPVDVPLPQCPGCTLGTTVDIVLVGTAQTFTIPANTQLVGLTFALQGVDLSTGPCLVGLSFGDTLDLTVR